jgi:hypothetical protein
MKRVQLVIFLAFIILNLGRSQTLNVPDNIGTSTNAGKIGIGTTNPIDKLTLDEGNITLGNTTDQEYNIIFRPGDNSWRSALVGYSSGTPANDYIGLQTKYGSIRFITNSGNVGIGTTNPKAKLSVNGTIISNEIKVLTDISQYPDYVFSDDYNLKPLKEVEKYIKENNHLPNIPKAEEVKEGVALGEMNAKLLQKIEELTLYMIQMNKEIENLKEENRLLKEQKSL